jgi:hypothetical protein
VIPFAKTIHILSYFPPSFRRFHLAPAKANAKANLHNKANKHERAKNDFSSSPLEKTPE